MLRLTDIAAKGSILLCVYGLFGFGNGIFQISRRNEAYGFIYDLSSLEVEKGGNAHDSETGCQIHFFIYVYLVEMYLRMNLCHAFYCGSQHFAGTAPGCEEINDYYVVTGIYCLVEISGCEM